MSISIEIWRYAKYFCGRNQKKFNRLSRWVGWDAGREISMFTFRAVKFLNFNLRRITFSLLNF